LKHLTADIPPDALFADEKRTTANDGWTEDSIRLCLALYLSLMPTNHQLIQLYEPIVFVQRKYNFVLFVVV